MLKFPLTVVAVPGVILTLATATAAQTFPTNLPIAITCQNQQDKSWRVGYLYKVDANGVAIYMAADAKLSTTVNAKGIVETPTNRLGRLDCYGKTLDELRANGRLMDFPRGR
jgi:hypothetical protein